jgi:hypothetical protein
MKRTLLSLISFAAFVSSVAGLPVFGQEDAKPQLPQEERVQERHLQEETFQEQRPDEERLQDRRLQDQRRLQEQRLQAQQLRRLGRQKLKIIYVTPEMKKGRPHDLAQVRIQAAGGATIPLWNYSTKGYDGNTYAGMMVGRSPFFHGKRATTIPTVIVPVKLTFADTGTIFDPTAPNICDPNGASVLSRILKSPIIQDASFTMNGANVGFTQYLDAFQRANFWSLVRGTPYHTVFSTSPPVILPAVSVTVPIADGSTQVGLLCGNFGEMQITWWDNLVQTSIIPSLVAQGVNPTTFPQIILDSVAELTPACCALGYHNSFLNGGVFQSYSVNEWDNSGTFDGDAEVMSHEVTEWMDDPNGSNPTPPWGFIGQDPSACQVGPTSTTSNLEVGDPLTGTDLSPVTLGGFAYTLQELAFFSWFYGGASLGSGGLYSNNGSFTGFAKTCPPGGTN